MKVLESCLEDVVLVGLWFPREQIRRLSNLSSSNHRLFSDLKVLEDRIPLLLCLVINFAVVDTCYCVRHHWEFYTSEEFVQWLEIGLLTLISDKALHRRLRKLNNIVLKSVILPNA